MLHSTPGPWRSGRNGTIKACSGKVATVLRRTDPKEVQANQVLISAAPRMAAALQRALAFDPRFAVIEDWVPIEAEIREALKAAGR